MMLTEPLAGLISRLESNLSISNQTMLELLSEANITREDIEQYSSYDHPANLSYGRRGVYLSDRVRVFVLSWNIGDFTAIHDHEPAEWGAVQFFGDISHRLYTTKENQIVLSASDVIHIGTMVGVSGNLIHAMGNLSAERALTLHIYGTNSKFNQDLTARVFDLEMERVVLTDGPAYLDRPATSCKVLPDRIRADQATLEDYQKNTLIWRNQTVTISQSR